DDPDREPGRGDDEGLRAGAPLRRLPAHREGPDDLRAERLPAGAAKRGEEVQLPRPAVALHDPEARRLEQGREALLRPERWRHGQDRGGPWKIGPPRLNSVLSTGRFRRTHERSSHVLMAAPQAVPRA